MNNKSNNQNAVVDAIKKAIKDAPERFPGYRNHLFTTVSELIVLEKNIKETNIPIQQRVNDKVDTLKKIYEDEISKNEGSSK
jgi:hypothetical protein